MVNIEELAEFLAASAIKKTNEECAKLLITRLEEKKGELKKQKIELKTNLEQTEKLIRDLVKGRADFFVSNKITSEIDERGESEFDLEGVNNFPEQSELIEQLFQKSLGELITKKCELEKSLKETVIKINEATRDKEKLEKALEYVKYGEDKLNDLEMTKEWTNWQHTKLSNELARKNKKINDTRVISKNLELKRQQMERELYLIHKPLPSLPKEKKFQKLVEKTEASVQKLIAKIETKTK